MKIAYPKKVIWRKPVDSESPAFYGKKLKRLKNFLAKIDENNIAFLIKPLDQTFLDWFVPMYEENIKGKENAKMFDVADRTLHNPISSHPYFALSITENDTPVAGTIFSNRPEYISVAFKVAENTWGNKSLQLGPSLYTEHLLYEWAKENNKQFISMGMDSNPYGVNASIGLAEFKISSGYCPFVPKPFEESVFDTDAVNQDTLLFEMPGKDTRKIKVAHLLTSEPAKYERLGKYPEIVEIVVH